MSSHVTLTMNEATRAQIDHLARMTGKSKEAVLREVVEAGLKSYPPIQTKGIKALVDLAAWAEENYVTGPKDLSTNHNTYAWGE
jgi:predicted transcriptional regulator